MKQMTRSSVSIRVVQMKVISSKITSLEPPLFGSVLSRSHFTIIYQTKEWDNRAGRNEEWSGTSSVEEMRDEKSGVRSNVFQLGTKRMYYYCEFITILDHCTSFLLSPTSLTFAILLFFSPLHQVIYCPSSPARHRVDTCTSVTLEWRKNETDERG